MNGIVKFDPAEYNVMQSMAKSMVDSGFFSDVKQVAQAMVKIQAGHEIGLPPFASMSGIHIVQGKPVLGANLIATLVDSNPRYSYTIVTPEERQTQEMTLEWRRDGKVVGRSSFTMAEAQAAQLAGKDNWKKYPSDMLFARALTRGARRYAPGIFGGAPVYTPDEMGVDTDEDGQIVQGEIVTVTPPTSNGNPPSLASAIDEDIAAAEGRAFVPLAAQLLEITEDAVKERMKALGYTAIPGKPELRVQAFHKVREYQADAQPELIDSVAAATIVGAYSE